ncbi:hypothetical protein CTEN210_02774 [Chaetoceros tenuissimus]|uniref:Uncharacterized protein n=1 Tax=Chaetoceros tenuissimus TaxID=426638 RepID=A0AAD3CJK4_9STRA|nr:hypothetical protein CTEN210_02774 [Chaetoceros tenuissimus]
MLIPLELLRTITYGQQYLRERESWQQVVVVEEVTEIPENTFCFCKNIKRVIFSNTVVRIKAAAFSQCTSLTYIKFSINIEVIESAAFFKCDLIRVFIPPSCTHTGYSVFADNKNLAICHVPQQTQLGHLVIAGTKLIRLFETNESGGYSQSEVVNNWLAEEYQPRRKVFSP